MEKLVLVSTSERVLQLSAALNGKCGGNAGKHPFYEMLHVYYYLTQQIAITFDLCNDIITVIL